MKIDSIKLYFFEYPNFGDMLNLDVARYFGMNIKKCQTKDCDAVFIGSLLSDFVDAKKHFRLRYLFSPALKIWGTGFIRPPLSPQEKLRRPVDVYAVRGEISRDRLRGIIGEKLENVAIGDPGLLASRLLDVSKVAKKYRLGIIPHFVDKNNPLIEKIKVRDARMLDIQQTPLDFLKQLAECENVISSAMHGLIAADSLGIPNIRMVVSDKIIGGDYKFNDYYSAYGLTNHAIIDLRVIDEFREIDFIKEKYAITKEMVEKICNDLIAVFPYKHKVAGRPIADL